MRINVPVRGNRKLRTLVERVNDDRQVKGWWHVANVNAVVRMQINDHSWVHIQIVTNIALKLLRQLTKHGVEPNLVSRLRHDERRRGGRRRPRRAPPLRRDGRASGGSRGLLPLPRRAEDARAARRALRRARPHRDHVGGAAGDHEPPRLRQAADDRGGHRARRRRARHGEGPLAHSVRARLGLDPLALGRGDRRRGDQGRRGAADPDRDPDEQLLRDLPGRRAAEGEAARLGPRAVRRGRRAHRHGGREATRLDLPARDCARIRATIAARCCGVV